MVSQICTSDAPLVMNVAIISDYALIQPEWYHVLELFSFCSEERNVILVAEM
jgi:hypothetical protein